MYDDDILNIGPNVNNTYTKVNDGVNYNVNKLYSYTPTLLELPDIQCGEFKEKLTILIKGLLDDISNINNPDPYTPMLYEKNIHLKNAMDFIRAVFSCIYCIIKKIKDENNTENCYKDPIENTPQDVINPQQSLNILLDTFNLSNPNIDDKPIITISNNNEENKENTDSSTISASSSSSSSTSSRSSSEISSLSSNTFRTLSTR